MMRRIYFILSAVILLMSVSGCRHKGLDDEIEPTQRVRVEFDWSEAPEANPAGMCVHFYNAESGEYRCADFAGINGGEVVLPVGLYHVVTYNNDLEGVTIYGEDSFLSHGGFTRDANILEGMMGNSLPVTPRAPGSEEERATITPDMIWGHSMQDINIEHVDNDIFVVTLRPRELVCRYSYEIRNVSNLNQVYRMGAALSGMSRALTFHNEELDYENCTLAIPADKKDGTTVYGEFFTFGHHEENEAPHRMTLYVWMNDGRKLAYGVSRGDKFDVTSQVHNAPDKKRVHLIIDGLDLPVEFGEGAYQPSADDWDVEEHEVVF